MRKSKDSEPDPDRTSDLLDRDSDPGGPKTCGFGSPTLVFAKILYSLFGPPLINREMHMCDQVPFAVDGKVMQYMITRAALLLRAYPTTLQQDQLTIKETTVRIMDESTTKTPNPICRLFFTLTC